MANAPAYYYYEHTMPARRWMIHLGPRSGTNPDETHETIELINPVIHLVHGNRLPYAEFKFNLTNSSRRVVDMQLELGFARQVEISQFTFLNDNLATLLFWGELAVQTLSVVNSEQITVTATIEPYHFGATCVGAQYRSLADPHDPYQTNDPIVFNPLILARIEPNRSKYEHPTTDSSYYFWLHPDSARTAEAREFGQDNDIISLWSLADVVRTMTWVCNPTQAFITNPTKTDIEGWLQGAPDVKNLELPTGRYLSEYLDMILNPYGYGWAVTFSYDEDDIRVVSYRIFKLNNEEPLSVLQQKPGDSRGILLGYTNVASFELQTGIVGQANQVLAIGDYEEYEMTFELYRGFSEAQDSLTADDLTQSNQSGHYQEFQRAWRLWIANEGGDYCGTRTVRAPIPFTPPDLSISLGDGHLVRNRAPGDCLAFWKDDEAGEKKRRRPPYIEYYRPETTSWSALPSGWGETVLDDQIAVMFSGDAPPAELIALGDDARIRITCTIKGDRRLSYTSVKSDQSVNRRVNEIVVDVSDRYKFRKVQDIGDPLVDHASALLGQTADTRDDTLAIKAFADKMCDVEDAAVVRGTITMIGLHPELKVGQTLWVIQGRNISLNRLAATAVDKKYLQIVGMTHHLEKQETILRVAPILEEVA